jgi:hypothetical protein
MAELTQEGKEDMAAPANTGAAAGATAGAAAGWRGQVRSSLRGMGYAEGQAAVQAGPMTQTAGLTATAASAAVIDDEVAAPAVEPTVTLGSNAVVSANAISILKGILTAAGLTSGTITSGRRTSADQARIMYGNIERHGVAHQKALYGSTGDQIISAYETAKAVTGSTETTIRAAMQAKITEVGPSNVSKHCSDTHDVFDVGPSSISDDAAFTTALAAALAAGTISHYILPPGDPAFHIEVLL